MATPLRQITVMIFCVLVCATFAPDAYAFFVAGNWDESGTLYYVKWPFSTLDANRDGDVSGPDDGIKFTLEGGEYGWLPDEIDIIEQAFNVWESVPTAYIAFRLAETPIYEPVPESGTGILDQMNLLSIAVAGDNLDAGVGGGILAESFLTYYLEDGYVDVGEYQVPVTANRLLDVDLVVDGEAHRTAALSGLPSPDLLATLVHELGHVIGIQHSPLNNLREITSATGAIVLREAPAVALRDGTGSLRSVGATPTMFPLLFETDDSYGNITDGARDLAPSDIAAVSFLYPRGSQDRFFNIKHEARTSAGYGFPSLPITGAHIVAWCDSDNDPATPNIPLFSTMTGLYEWAEEPTRRQWFDLKGLYKRLETSSGLTFQASYVLTLNPFDGSGYRRQAPPGYTEVDFDSLHSSFSEDTRDDYSDGYQTQVFVEDGNVYDIEKRSLGTPLVYDSATGRVVSAESGNSLTVMRPGLEPMFGDRITEEVCPFNVVTAGLKSNDRFLRGLRGLRDDVLLQSAAGVAFVDTYYQAAPTIAGFLVRHRRALDAARLAAAALEWGLVRYPSVLLLAGALGALWAAYRRRRRTAWAMAGVLLLGCVLTFGGAVHARIMPLNTQQVVAMSDDIVTGRVTSVEAGFAQENQYKIVTDISVTVTDTIKGRLNKDGQLHLSVPGGRVGAMVTRTNHMPAFSPNEEVLLYLEYREGYGYVVVAGERGKYDVKTDPESGVKYVVAPTLAAKQGLKDAEAAVEKPDGRAAEEDPEAKPVPDGKVPLEEFKAYLRAIVKDQAAQKDAARP